MHTLILVVHVAAALTIVGLVLLQHGKGADAGAAFGSGSAGSVFGSAGSANFLSRATAIAAVVFFCTSMALTWMSSQNTGNRGVMSRPVPADSLPSQIPSPAAVPEAPAGGAPKAPEVPK